MTPLELSVLHELVEKAHDELEVKLADDARGLPLAMGMVAKFTMLIDYLEEHK